MSAQSSGTTVSRWRIVGELSTVAIIAVGLFLLTIGGIIMILFGVSNPIGLAIAAVGFVIGLVGFTGYRTTRSHRIRRQTTNPSSNR